jgi:multiple sugar transport system substrate-binding protein
MHVQKLKIDCTSWPDRARRGGRNHQWLVTGLRMAVVLLCANTCDATESLPKTISVATHEEANSPEFDVLKKAAETFNHRQRKYRVEIASAAAVGLNYESWVHREAAAGTLPCLLEFDGPSMAAFAWPQYLLPIERFVPPELLRDLLPSIVAQGTYQGLLYSLGQFDSGVGLWGNRRYLRAAGVRIATLKAPWSLAEFEQALARLSALDSVDYAISFGLAGGGEFYSYAYSPILQSFGGDLIDRRHYRTARGVLDGPQSVEAMRRFQSWFQKGWALPDFDRPYDFQNGKSALSWSGHWGYRLYHKALGKDLVWMPLPDFGRGIKTGMGSWSWGITSTCQAPAGAWAFLAYLLSPRVIVRMTNVNNGIPAHRSALVQSPLYGPHGPLRFFVPQLEMGGVSRPITPAYGTISRAFTEAVTRIVTGDDVQSSLSKAADTIDQTIAAHRGYPYP